MSAAVLFLNTPCFSAEAASLYVGVLFEEITVAVGTSDSDFQLQPNALGSRFGAIQDFFVMALRQEDQLTVIPEVQVPQIRVSV